jgi:hypothetical protein
MKKTKIKNSEFGIQNPGKTSEASILDSDFWILGSRGFYGR